MNLCIVWTRDDGGVSVTIPAEGARLPEESDEDFVQRIAAKDVPQDRPQHIQRSDSLPSRRFRNSWVVRQAKVLVDVERARETVLAEVRVERDRLLDLSDREYLRVQETGTSAERDKLTAKRTALRNMPAVVKEAISCMSVPELETYRPTWPV